MPKGKGKSAVVEELDDDLELIEDEDEAPAKKTKKAKTAPAKAEKTESTGYGASWLAEYVNEELNTEFTAANMRVILRKMAADGDIEREVGTDRARYSFTGENDKIVKAVLKRVRSGEADKIKEDRIEAARSGKGSANVKRKAKDEDAEIEEAPVKAKRKKSAVVEDADEAPKAKATRKRNA